MPEDDSLNRTVYEDCSMGGVVLMGLINDWDCVMQVINESKMNISFVIAQRQIATCRTGRRLLLISVYYIFIDSNEYGVVLMNSRLHLLLEEVLLAL